MKKIQPPYFTTCIGLIASVITASSIAQSRPATQTYLDSHPSIYLLSSNNFCHGSLSEAQASVVLTMPKVVGGVPANVYLTLDACEAAGGQLTKNEEIKRQVKTAITIQNTIKKEEKKIQAEEDTNNFYGFNWAPGIAVLFYNTPYIDDIRIESTGEGDEQINRVFIDTEIEKNIAVVLETHYLWKLTNNSNRDTGWGFFASTNLVKEEGSPLTTFAAGVMFAVKDKEGSNGLSVGIGYFVDTDFKTLRNGLVDGSETTYQDSSKLIRKVDEEGWMLMISSKF